VQLGGITAMIRILVVDDHDATRRSLSSFLAHEDKFTICGEAADGVQAIEQARNLSPDAIVMDVSMPKMDGLSAARIIRRENPTTQIVIISLKEPSILRAVASRIGLAFIDKTKITNDLIPALHHLTKFSA
jgi:DNA-binding NarL/FixJ family response regulator